MKQAMIFAAGLGTRLKPLTDVRPKALVEVGGVPLLQYVILRLKDAGFERIVVNVHHFAGQIIDFIRQHHNFDLDIRISDESDRLLDTGGGVKKAIPLFDPLSPILIHNVDILSNVDLAHMYSCGTEAGATLLVSQRHTKRYLLFSPGKSRLLKGWTNIETREVKSPYGSINPAVYERFAFSGIHIFSPSLFPLMKTMPDKFGIIDFYLKACKTYSILGYIKDDLQLMDVGKLDTLSKADDFLKQMNYHTIPLSCNKK